MGYSERHRQAVACSREEERRMGLTFKDNWEGNEDGFIKHLVNGSGSRWRVIDGEKKLVTIRGFEHADDFFDDYDDKDSYSYKHAKGRDYLDWMLNVKTRYESLKQSKQIKDLTESQKAKAEREEYEYWALLNG